MHIGPPLLVAALAVAAVLVPSGASAQRARDRMATGACEFRAMPSRSTPGCMVIVGFSNGTRVGEYRPNVDGQRRLVGTTPACLANPSYARELGRLIDSNRVAFRGRTISLDETCRRER